MHVVYVSGEQMFSLLQNNEAYVVIEHLKTVLFVCGLFKTYYVEYKAKSATECPLIRRKFKTIFCLSVSIQLWSVDMMFLILLTLLF